MRISALGSAFRVIVGVLALAVGAGALLADPHNLPLDLVSDRQDGNKFPINPWWSIQKGSPPMSIVTPSLVCPEMPLSRDHFMTCTSQITSDEWTGKFLAICNPNFTIAPGIAKFLDVCDATQSQACSNYWTHHPTTEAVHFNWGLATFIGSVHAGDLLGSGPDEDLNIDLLPTDPADISKPAVPVAVTAGTACYLGHPDRIHIEFDRAESAAFMADDQVWLAKWVRLIDAEWDASQTLHPDIRPALHDMQCDGLGDCRTPCLKNNGPGCLAVVTGLVGIDVEHCETTEVHPAVGFALRVGHELISPGKLRERWTFFLRNRGDEGDCGRGKHGIPASLGSLDLSLPWPLEGTWQRASLNVESSSHVYGSLQNGQLPSLDIIYAPGAVISVGAAMPPVSAGLALIYGQLVLDFTQAPEPIAAAAVPGEDPSGSFDFDGATTVHTGVTRFPRPEEILRAVLNDEEYHHFQTASLPAQQKLLSKVAGVTTLTIAPIKTYHLTLSPDLKTSWNARSDVFPAHEAKGPGVGQEAIASKIHGLYQSWVAVQ